MAPCLALLLALWLHGWLIDRLRPASPRTVLAIEGSSVQLRVLETVTATATPALESSAGPMATKAPAIARADPPGAPQSPSRTSPPRPDDTHLRTPETSAAQPASIPIGTTVLAMSPLTPPPAGEGQLHFQLRHEQQDGDAWLHWRISGDRYRFTLIRRLGDRELPQWHSEGRWGPRGLMPITHQVTQQGRRRESMQFLRDEEAPDAQASTRLRVGAQTHDLPVGTQDRLSWWMQLASMVAARPTLAVGEVLQIPVASAQGARAWDFVVAAHEPGTWHLVRRLPAHAGRPALRWEVWLARAEPRWPVRIEFSVDDQVQWTLARELPAAASSVPSAQGDASSSPGG